MFTPYDPSFYGVFWEHVLLISLVIWGWGWSKLFSFNSRENGRKKFPEKSSTFSRVHQLKFFHSCKSGSSGGQGFAVRTDFGTGHFSTGVSISKTCLLWSDLWVLQRYRARGAPKPLSRPLRMPQNNSKETYSVPREGYILVKNMWSDSQVLQRYRTRGAFFPIHEDPRMPKNSS